jgi:uncharacterized Zn ribbon protein
MEDNKCPFCDTYYGYEDLSDNLCEMCEDILQEYNNLDNNKKK